MTEEQMSEFGQVAVVTKDGEPHLVFRSPHRALEYVNMTNATAPGEPYGLILFAIADAAATK